jgi:hypothetical protein
MVTTAKSVPLSAHNFAHAGASDLRMLAQVEKWMAMIRDINREQHGPTGLPTLNALAVGITPVQPLTR